MNDIDELKHAAVTAARARGIPRVRYHEVLRRIRTDDRGLPGSWVREWSGAAERLRLRDRLLDACRHYDMARFPYVDGPAREYALQRCTAVFDRWRRRNTDIQRVEVELADGRVSCWTSGLSAAEPRPLLIVMGGITGVKEQWAPVLAQAGRLGMAVVATEMPGVGENTLRYGSRSRRMLPEVLDAVAGRADVRQAYVATLGFGGHMALRSALEDSRLRGIIMAEAPVSGFFTQAAGRRAVPGVTMDTLSHLTGVRPADLFTFMYDWALTGQELAAIKIPVSYLASRRDEITPGTDVDHMKRHVQGLRLIKDDHVRYPSYSAETRLWIVRSLLHMREVRGSRRATAGFQARALRARRLLSAA